MVTPSRPLPPTGTPLCNEGTLLQPPEPPSYAPLARGGSAARAGSAGLEGCGFGDLPSGFAFGVWRGGCGVGGSAVPSLDPLCCHRHGGSVTEPLLLLVLRRADLIGAYQTH